MHLQFCWSTPSHHRGILYAQAVTGSLLGTVTDASGAAVPGAKVTITETNAGIVRTAQTNESGNYTFAALEPGFIASRLPRPVSGRR